jgi:hypothetical protein
MSCVFQNIDPPPPSPPGECVPSAFVAGGGHTRWVVRGVGGSVFWKTQDTALYSTYKESSLIFMDLFCGILIDLPVGIYKEAYLKEIFKKYGDEEEAPEPPILPDWCYEVRPKRREYKEFII